ncbi:Peptidase T [Dorea longicatena]|uniref:Peptidase T n=1 Tax=Dorea longicatena TaxID=88431 RepID=A0A564T706_9FIRM|nr:Peptidase T [Dorea longicatena]
MKAYERFLKYVSVWTTSNENSETVPSADRELVLAKLLVEEMKELGIVDARVDIVPDVAPIRGGTDGARLSFKGLPCPNLGTGGYAFHGVYEHITVEGMDKAVVMVKDIVGMFAK